MPVVDTEVLFALSPRDPRHPQVLELLKSRADILAPDTAMLEFQAVLRDRGKKQAEVKAALLALREALARFNVKEVKTIDFGLLALQCDLEGEHELSYFDGLIAASALALDHKLISNDEAFDRVPGLERIPLPTHK
jgi:predicted nucleic acid-binding protein